MDAVIYTRVSKLAGGRSVEDQERECRAASEHNNWPIRAVFCDDGISASRYGKERPAWAALKAELRQGDILVVWEASRAHRDLEEFVALRNLCAQLDVPLSYSGRILNLTNGDDRFVGGLDALVAERESEQIKARVLRGKRAAAAEGRPSTRPPWGYRLVRPGEWEFDPVEAPRVREAVERLLAGDTMYSVMRWIEETEGFTPSSLTNLRRALTNPALAGLRVHQGETLQGVRGTWEPIVTEQQHKDLVRQLKRMKRTAGYTSRPGPEPKYLLTGIAKCGECGEGLRRKPGKGKRNPSYVCYLGHCSRVAHEMDAAVEKALFEFCPLMIHIAEAQGVRPVDDQGAQDAIRQIEELEETLEEWTQAAIKGEISPGAFAKIEKGLRAQIEALEPKTAPPNRRIPDVQDFETEWAHMSMRQRREQVRLSLTITVVPAERRGTRTGKLVIEPGGELYDDDNSILSRLFYRIPTGEPDGWDGWILRGPDGTLYDASRFEWKH
jgi:site-specific DNA recombinase